MRAPGGVPSRRRDQLRAREHLLERVRDRVQHERVERLRSPPSVRCVRRALVDPDRDVDSPRRPRSPSTIERPGRVRAQDATRNARSRVEADDRGAATATAPRRAVRTSSASSVKRSREHDRRPVRPRRRDGRGDSTRGSRRPRSSSWRTVPSAGDRAHACWRIGCGSSLWAAGSRGWAPRSRVRATGTR